MYSRFLSRCYRHLAPVTKRFTRRPAPRKWPPSSSIPVTLTVIGGGSLLGGLLLGIARNDDASKIAELEPPQPMTTTDSEIQKLEYTKEIRNCRRMIQFKKEELGLPAVLIAVSVDGKLVWQEGFGYSDVENLTSCRSDTSMRIASISKPIAMAIAARLIDQGKLDIDQPIQHYVPKFPQKTVHGQKVAITTRQLLSHLGGIRHYEKNSTKDSISDGEMAEFYIKDEYKTVSEALEIFMNDDLEHKPGSKFLYTTHGWTVISAVLEGASGLDFVKLTQNLYKDLGMEKSYLGYHVPLIPNQARYYKRGERSRLENAPYVDLSCKWAGGGLISTVKDLSTFGNVLLHSYQSQHGYITKATMREMWAVVEASRGKVKWVQNGGYGLGWGVDEGNQDTRNGELKPFYASHTGGACGASSVLTVIPASDGGDSPEGGVVVAMITNLQAVGLAKLALEIGRMFEERKNDV